MNTVALSREEKLNYAYYLNSVINARSIFAAPIPEKEKITHEENMILDGRRLLVSGAVLDVISLGLTKEYTDFNIFCLGRNLSLKRRFNTNPDSLASYQAEKSKSGGLLGNGWVMEYEMYCRYDENSLVIVNTDNEKDYFFKQGGAWKNRNPNSLTTVAKENNTKNEITICKERLYYTFHFDGRLKSILSSNQTGIELNYLDNSPLIERIVSTCGKSLSFSYRNNKVERITDHVGRDVKYSYRGDWLDSVEQLNSGLWEFEYVQKLNKLSKVTDPMENTDFEVAFDWKGKPIILYIQGDLSWKIEHDDRNKTKIFSIMRYPFSMACYASKGKIDKPLKDLFGFSVQYDHSGLIRKMICYEDTILQFDYDDRANLTSKESSGSGHIITTYDAYNRMTSKTYADGSWKKLYWGTNGFLHKKVKSNGYERIYEYDGAGNLIEKRTKIYKGVTAVMRYEYDAKGRIIAEIDANKNKTGYIYTFESGVLPNITEYPNGFTLEHRYDDLGRLIYENNFGVETTIIYNNIDKPVQIEKNGLVEYRRYDLLGHLREVVAPKSVQALGSSQHGDRKYYYIYNENYNITYTINPAGNKEWMFKHQDEQPDKPDQLNEYDYMGNVTVRRIPDPENAGLFHVSLLEYDKNQNLVVEKKGIGPVAPDKLPLSYIITRYEYDNRNNISRIHDNSGKDCKYFYKGINRLSKVSRRINDRKEQALLFEYDENGLLSAAIEMLDLDDVDIYKTGIDANSVSTVRIRTGFTYNSENLLSAIILPDGCECQILYDENGQAILTEKNRLLQKIPSVLDKVGWIIKPLSIKQLDCISNIELNQAINRESHNYDKFGRIIKKALPDGCHELFEYDYDGNISSFTDCGDHVTRYCYNSINRIKEITSTTGEKTT